MRTYAGLPGVEAMLKQYGIVGTRGAKGPWVQGNNIDFVLFSPGLKAFTYEGLKEVTPEPTTDGQNAIRWVYTVIGGASRLKGPPVAAGAMKKIVEIYPPKDKETIRIPWHLNADTALFFASFEDRRIVAVPSVKGAVSPKVAAGLGDLEVLKKHVHNYAFLRLEPDQVPSELQAAMQEAGPDGLVIVERPEGRERGVSPWKSAPVLAVSTAPHARDAVLPLLDKHARPPGWDAKLPPAK